MIELKFTAESALELAEHLTDVAGMMGGEPAAKTETAKAEATKAEATKDEAEAPKRKRRTKAEIEAEAEVEAEAEAESANLNYEKDLRPLMATLVNQPNGGREQAVAILKHFGVANGKDLKPGQLGEAMQMVQAKIEELQAADEDFI